MALQGLRRNGPAISWPEAQAQARLRGAPFAPIAPVLARLDPARWPALDELTELARGTFTARGLAIRFVPPRAQNARAGFNYESHIAQTGEIETRPENWHDLFNALAWIAFPKAKAMINAQHAALLLAGGEQEARRRSPARDALTLFDEGGIVVAYRSPALLRQIVDFEWKELFWHRRAQLREELLFLGFGHALFEMALDPFIGIVAKTVFVPVGDSFLSSPREAQVAEVDAGLAAHFADRARFASPRSMAPLPVLGIPGWYPDTDREAFYDDASHFRRKRGRFPLIDNG